MRILYLSVIAISLLTLAGCGAGSGTPTTNPDLVITSAAVTVQAELTRRAGFSPTPSPTAESTATSTPELPTATPSQPEASPTSLVASPLPTSTVKDAANYISQSVQDGTKYKPGESFEVTWVLINAGESTWTTDYKILFFSGDQMGAPNSLPMPKEVAPNATVEITVTFTAPNEVGKKRTIWVLNNPGTGRNFYNFYLDIEVVADQ